MESNRQLGRLGVWIFAVMIIAFASLLVISALYGRFSTTDYPSFFFFGWWIFIPLFFFGIFFFFRWWGWGYWSNPGRYHDPALETLRERFARGEITKEQYERIRENLEER
jgi:uncharacterized membrane protein